ncbi:unnamed protein product [Ranitomeya imitator]|uniref:Protein kinase domain-containing protein n=1 Tax=Ranitomeya imitator TaxID=111125 RepID=A0ABN9M0R0_9NEOB|nr:unnamed protein product [Ranitomeya imitator]
MSIPLMRLLMQSLTHVKELASAAEEEERLDDSQPLSAQGTLLDEMADEEEEEDDGDEYLWEEDAFQGAIETGGVASSAYDTKTEQRVAVKKLSRPFQSIIHAKRTYRELRLLKHMKHENVIGLLDVFTPSKSFEEFNDVYLVTHLMGADLNNIVKCQKLTDDHVQFLIYQILRGLKVL